MEGDEVGADIVRVKCLEERKRVQEETKVPAMRAPSCLT